MTLPVILRVAQPLVLSAWVLCAACGEHLPPAETPAPVAPAVESSAPPAEGQGRLIVDVLEGPTPVHRVFMAAERIGGASSYRLYETSELLCPRSPCVADLPAGNVLLGFPVLGDRDAMDVELVHIGPETSVHRRSLSVRQGGGAIHTLGIVGTSIGGTAMAAGAALLPIGLAKDKDGLTTAGAITLGTGAVLLTLGILGIVNDPPIHRPGSSIHFTLPGGGE